MSRKYWNDSELRRDWLGMPEQSLRVHLASLPGEELHKLLKALVATGELAERGNHHGHYKVLQDAANRAEEYAPKSGQLQLMEVA